MFNWIGSCYLEVLIMFKRFYSNFSLFVTFMSFMTLVSETALFEWDKYCCSTASCPSVLQECIYVQMSQSWFLLFFTGRWKLILPLRVLCKCSATCALYILSIYDSLPPEICFNKKWNVRKEKEPLFLWPGFPFQGNSPCDIYYFWYLYFEETLCQKWKKNWKP